MPFETYRSFRVPVLEGTLQLRYEPGWPGFELRFASAEGEAFQTVSISSDNLVVLQDQIRSALTVRTHKVAD